MVDLIERIGPVLGLVAFVGLAILAFLIFQQARELRRLREWAGAAPERARQASEASLAAAEARNEVAPRKAAEPGSPRMSIREGLSGSWRSVAHGSPVPPHYLLIAFGVLLIAGGLFAGGLGVLGGEDDGGSGDGGVPRGEIEVAVLNATQLADGETEIQGVPGLATAVADEVLGPAGYKIGRTANSPAPSEETVIMYAPGGERAARRLARDIRRKLGEAAVRQLSGELRGIAEEADLTVVVGLDNAEFEG